MPKHIVSFSGGKDSTAMLLMMLERGMQIDEIRCFDTGWEFPQMYDHWKQVEAYTGREITILRPKKSFEYWMLNHNLKPRKNTNCMRKGYGWPAPMTRWCTAIKRDTLNRNIAQNTIKYVGIAFDERKREKDDVKIRYPLIEQCITEAEALKYCMNRGFTWGGLYDIFRRVSCFCCPLQPLGEVRKIRKHFPYLWTQMLEWDSQVRDSTIPFKFVGVHALDARFSREDMQSKLFEDV
jgi:3'-phosphoadenosine 5'-phosphosulfate sulfotransferase (PAPS reductase)/FAD synthetase